MFSFTSFLLDATVFLPLVFGAHGTPVIADAESVTVPPAIVSPAPDFNEGNVVPVLPDDMNAIVTDAVGLWSYDACLADTGVNDCLTNVWFSYEVTRQDAAEQWRVAVRTRRGSSVAVGTEYFTLPYTY